MENNQNRHLLVNSAFGTYTGKKLAEVIFFPEPWDMPFNGR